MTEDRLNSLKEASYRTGLKEVTLRKWAAERKFDVVRLGRRLLIHEREIQRLIAENTIPRLPERAR